MRDRDSSCRCGERTRHRGRDVTDHHDPARLKLVQATDESQMTFAVCAPAMPSSRSGLGIANCSKKMPAIHVIGMLPGMDDHSFAR